MSDKTIEELEDEISTLERIIEEYRGTGDMECHSVYQGLQDYLYELDELETELCIMTGYYTCPEDFER